MRADFMSAKAWIGIVPEARTTALTAGTQAFELAVPGKP
jgi:hypothetical protein